MSKGNTLFPVFLKLEELNTVIVGGGNVGLEKLNTVLANSPEARVDLIASKIDTRILRLAEKYSLVQLHERSFRDSDVDRADIVIVAVNDADTCGYIRSIARAKGKLVNAADKPAYCDFYLGAVVQKGNLKLSISTNGKSPTVARKLKEMLSEVIPEQMESLLANMEIIRGKLKGNLARKIQKLNEITTDLKLD